MRSLSLSFIFTLLMGSAATPAAQPKLAPELSLGRGGVADTSLTDDLCLTTPDATGSEFTRTATIPGAGVGVTVPVFFHLLIADDGVTGNVSDAVLDTQVAMLNEAFGDGRCSNCTSSTVRNNYTFVKAGVSRTVNGDWHDRHTVQDSDPEVLAIKSALAVDPSRALNVYVADMPGGGVGFGTFPDEYVEDDYRRSIFIDYVVLPSGRSSYDLGFILVHEVGHNFGLYHTWSPIEIPPPETTAVALDMELVCYPEDDCNIQPDFVCDTPEHSIPQYQCGDAGSPCYDEPAPLHNFMNYANERSCFPETVHFTAGQHERMAAQLLEYWPTLVDPADPDRIVVDADRVIAPDQRWTLFGSVPFAFDGARVVVQSGSFSAQGATLTALNPNGGLASWGGLRYEAGSTGVLDGVTIEHAGWVGGAAVTIVDASPTIRNSTIQNSLPYGEVRGILVTGSQSDPQILGNEIRDMSGDGIAVVTGAHTYAMLDRNLLLGNGGDGIAFGPNASGFVINNTAGGTSLVGNGGAGYSAAAGATPAFGIYFSGYQQYGENTAAFNGAAGLYAEDGAYVSAGASTFGRNNRLFRNGPGGDFQSFPYDGNGPDAEARTGATLAARYNWWGRPPSKAFPTPDLVADANAAIYWSPMLACDPAASGCNPTREAGPAGIPRGGSTADSLLLLAEMALHQGHYREAYRQARAAVVAEPTGPVASAAVGLAGRLCAAVPEAPEYLAQAEAAASPARRPWVQRAQVACHRARGDEAAALAVAAVLAEGSGTGHAIYGYLAAMDLHLEAGDVASAETAWGAAAALAPESRGVRLAGSALAAAGGALEPGNARSSAQANTRDREAPKLFAVGAAYPNPTASGLLVPVVLPVAGTVRMAAFDVLGREVDRQTVDLGTGSHDVSLSLGAAPAGLYVVRVEVGDLVRSQRVTVLR